MRLTRIGATGLVLVAAVAFIGCGAGNEQQPVGVAAKVGGEPLSAVPDQDELNRLAGIGVSADYEPVRTMKGLARQSEVVVRGEITDLREGRTWRSWYSEDGYDDMVSLIVTVQPEEIEVGALPAGTDGNLYLELPTFGLGPGGPDGRPIRDYERLNQLLGLKTIVYVVPAPGERPGGGDLILDPEAGRPEGQPLFQLTHPQGFQAETPDGKGAWDVGEGAAFKPGVTLDDLSPLTGGKFPEYQPWGE